MNSNHKSVKTSFLCSDPMFLDDDDLVIIRSALMKVRKSSGSVRADRIIEMINHQLNNPDTTVCSFTSEVPFA